MECIQVDKEKKYINDFLSLPKKLYTSSTNMESADSMRSLLLGTHPLSKYFSIDFFVIYEGTEAVGRFGITEYEGDENAYLGFFECVKRDEVAKFLFEEADRIVKGKGKTKIVGPVDASFWLKYRLKINMFDKAPYTGEPYNREYYFDLFRNNGYVVREHYTSNAYRAVDETYTNDKFEERYKQFLANGYTIESPTVEGYDEAVDAVYDLITELYSDFPIYKDVKREDFRELFASYKSIMNMSMTKIAYFNGKAVGFYISLPDYGSKVYHLNPVNILKILKLRKKPDRYVMLYMGVDQSHRGLGKAIVYSIMKELESNKLPSIGALARDGKVTQTYVIEEATDIYEYVLMEHDLGGDNK